MISILQSDFTENSRPVRNSWLLKEEVAYCTSSVISAQQIVYLNNSTSFWLGKPLQTNVNFLMFIFQVLYAIDMTKRRLFFTFDLGVWKVQ